MNHGVNKIRSGAGMNVCERPRLITVVPGVCRNVQDLDKKNAFPEIGLNTMQKRSNTIDLGVTTI